MNKLRLNQVLPTMPRYQNNFKKGPYKNGNFSGVSIIVRGNINYAHQYDANNFPRELLEQPYYVNKIYSVVLSAYCKSVNTGIYIELEKEENKYV